MFSMLTLCLMRFGPQMDKNHSGSRMETVINISWDILKSISPRWEVIWCFPRRTDLSVYLSFPPSLPPSSPEPSQTQMFYTAYEMFEGHRKRKSAWAWFPLCRVLQGPSSSSSACTHLPQHGYTGGLVVSMYNQPSNTRRGTLHTYDGHMTAWSVCAGVCVCWW